MEAHNGLSARIVDEHRFDGVWASGLTIATSLGRRDANEASSSQLVDVVETIVDATHLPVPVDGDTGFGNFNNVRTFILKLASRGVAGVCLEDKQFTKPNPFLSTEHAPAPVPEFCGKIKAACDARADHGFAVVARVEALVAGRSLAEALGRADAYVAAGATAVLIHPRLPRADEVRDRGARIAEGATARCSDSRFGGSLHTDGAECAPPLPRRFALACVRPAARGGELQLVSALALHDRLVAEAPDAVDTLHRRFHFERRGVPGPQGEATVLKRVFWFDHGRLCATYLRGYIEAGHRQPGVPPLDAAQVAALDAMDRLLAHPDLVVAGTLRAGDVAIVDNRAVLHGRTTFEDDPGGDGRLLLRAWWR